MAVTRSSPAARRSASRPRAKYDLVLNEAHVNAAANDTFDKSGIAKNAREEKIRARDAKLKQDAENARMAKLYRKEILQEPDAPAGFISLGEIKPAAPVAKVRRDRRRRLSTTNRSNRKAASNGGLSFSAVQPLFMHVLELQHWY